ncbi:unnamed protein product [Fraxinus pennsylvanica]|uniref:Serine/threonine-protein kinase PRP4 homolog n=1 Tax=Fraxinus pennsylvanica TaxID=56036 RepID=A0AAD2AHW3_9LAMI|nr:unnamed protein product [Fraxinus pennsylvanica]
MASDSGEPTRRNHRRSVSTEDSEEPSKRRKHHRHHRHRHHRHRSKKETEETFKKADEKLEGGGIDEIQVEERKLEGDVMKNGDEGAVGEVLGSTGVGFVDVDYDMEEGEIVEDEGLNDNGDGYFGKQKKLDSDVESGEIETDRHDNIITEISEENMYIVSKNLRKFGDAKRGDEMDWERTNYAEGLSNGNHVHKCHSDRTRNHTVDASPLEGVDKRISEYDYETQGSFQGKSLSSEKRHRIVSHSPSHDKYGKESSSRNVSKSPDWSRGRSRSRSIFREASVVSTLHKQEDSSYTERRHRSGSYDERVIAHDRDYIQSSRDVVRDTERERSCSIYSDRMERHPSRETYDKYREGSRDRTREQDGERERKRESEREREREREMTRHRDRDRDRDREREKGREREKERDRLREDRDRDRDRARDGVRERREVRGRDRDRDRERENESDIRRHKYNSINDGYGDRGWYNDSRHRKNSENDHRERSRKTDSENVSSKSNLAERIAENIKREEDEQEDYQERIAMQLEEQEEDLERIREESRRRKQAILEKYKNKQSQQQIGTQSQDMDKEQVGQSSDQVAATDLVENVDGQAESADVYIADPSFSVGKSPSQNGLSALERPTGIGGLGEGTPKSERSDDMFCDDIFGESPAGARKTGKGEGLVAVEKSGLHDNWDDSEGYYGYRFGETLDGRYEIIAAHGKGVFSTVVRAKDLKAKPGDPEEVAIKIIRSNETMYKAGMEELVILKKLVGADPEDKRHCVRFLSNFKYRNHLCLVFESLHMNLREVLKKFGRNIGLKLTAVRAYAKQLFIALKHLKNCGVLHCDIKPDNMLVNESKNVLKLCDFGNAMFAGKNEITPYLVSRFYRAPEIILGLPYDHPMDIWSVGCCLFELYAGKVLFPGATNNDMLRLHMELKGPFPKKMLRKGAFTDQHFNQDLNFLAVEEDPVSKKAIRRLIFNIKPKDSSTLISGSPGEDPKMLANFKDLLERIFVLDPDKRINVSQALSHPFITEFRRRWLAWLKSSEKMLGETCYWQYFQWIVFCFYRYLPVL